MNKLKLMLSFFIVLSTFFLASCGQADNKGQLKSVGLLVSGTVTDQVWGTKGYKGLLNIQSKYNVDVYYKEYVDSLALTESAVEEFKHKGVNLIFGHGSEYAEFFDILSKKYPDIHFISFNSSANNENTTSASFDGYTMGFFGGMVAGHMTKTNIISVIAAFDTQPEVQGFKDGAMYENENVKVLTDFVQSWDNREKALKLLDTAIANEADIIYPAGDGFNVDIIEQVKAKGLYAIGYVSDQSDLGKMTVLTSTVQDVSEMFDILASDFNEGKLKSGNISYGMKENVITLGKFSPSIDAAFIEKINQGIKQYKQTGKFPSKQ